MNEDPEKQQQDAEATLEEELRRARKFNPNEALARMAGPGAMKGASPISPVTQAEVEIGNWLEENLGDDAGAVQLLLHRNLKGSQALLDHLNRPLAALAQHCEKLLASDYLLKELVREADVEWGRKMDERPHFDREGSPPDPADPYTAESVRKLLTGAVKLLTGPAG